MESITLKSGRSFEVLGSIEYPFKIESFAQISYCTDDVVDNIHRGISKAVSCLGVKRGDLYRLYFRVNEDKLDQPLEEWVSDWNICSYVEKVDFEEVDNEDVNEVKTYE